jgi:hypothetical protein
MTTSQRNVGGKRLIWLGVHHPSLSHLVSDTSPLRCVLRLVLPLTF